MTVIINGTTGITNVNGSAAAPAETGTDTDTGIVYGTNTITLATNGTAGLNQDASQNLGIALSPFAWEANAAIDIGSTLATSAGYSKRGVTYNSYFDGTNWKYKYTGTPALYQQGGSSHYFYGAVSGSAGANISFVSVLGVEKGGTVSLEGASVQSGTGITFPATQSASSNANTLDDYEEGTWTPAITGSVSDPTITYSVQTGNYIKVGALVKATFGVYVNTISGGSGYARISLPFSSAGYSSQGALRVENATGISTYNMAVIDDLGSTARCYIRINTNGTGNGADLQISNLQSGTRLVGTYMYWA